MLDHVYRRRFERLKLVHKFNFDGRAFRSNADGTVKMSDKNKSRRKGAITKAWKKYGRLSAKVESGEYDFVSATKAQVRHLKDQFPHTNIGIIYNKRVDAGTQRRTEIFGRGENTQLLGNIKISNARDAAHARKLTFYLKFPTSLNRMNVDVYVHTVWMFLKPDYVSVAINGYAGTRMVDAASFKKYLESEIMGEVGQIIDENTSDYIYTGIYIIYYKKAVSKKWLDNLKKKLMKFQAS